MPALPCLAHPSICPVVCTGGVACALTRGGGVPAGSAGGHALHARPPGPGGGRARVEEGHAGLHRAGPAAGQGRGAREPPGWHPGVSGDLRALWGHTQCEDMVAAGGCQVLPSGRCHACLSSSCQHVLSQLPALSTGHVSNEAYKSARSVMSIVQAIPPEQWVCQYGDHQRRLVDAETSKAYVLFYCRNTQSCSCCCNTADPSSCRMGTLSHPSVPQGGFGTLPRKQDHRARQLQMDSVRR